MLLLRCGLATLLALALLASTTPARTALAPVARAAELPAGIPSVFVHLPPELPRGEPLQVLVALHGMGGSGDQFANSVLAQAERNHWLLVAPTIDYGDWTDPNQVAREDPRLIRWLSDYLDHLSEYVGLNVKRRVLLLGHSRGAQLAHRFALFQPERVLAVAAVAAGTYTLPVERTNDGALLRFPFGLGDLARLSGHSFSRLHLVEDTQFWLGVGSEDNNPNDLPRAWDPYLGTTRVARAQAFQAALHDLGARSVLIAFTGEKHVLSPAMAASACSFLRGLDLAQSEPARLRPHSRGRL
jgi:pimeloyl-ACP methyl ester carboxylesterase